MTIDPFYIVAVGLLATPLIVGIVDWLICKTNNS